MAGHWLSSLHNSHWKCGVEQCFAGKLHFCILMDGKKNGEITFGTNRMLIEIENTLNIRVIRDVTPCIVIDGWQPFKGKCCLHLEVGLWYLRAQAVGFCETLVPVY
jgi:hypothetical protein